MIEGTKIEKEVAIETIEIEMITIQITTNISEALIIHIIMTATQAMTSVTGAEKTGDRNVI